MRNHPKFKKLEKFIDILVKYERDNPEDLMPPATDTQFVLNCLIEALLGPNYYISISCNNNQANTIILDDILKTYSKDYRKLVKKKQKELRTYGKT